MITSKVNSHSNKSWSGGIGKSMFQLREVNWVGLHE
jgi:hypothetical protein